MNVALFPLLYFDGHSEFHPKHGTLNLYVLWFQRCQPGQIATFDLDSNSLGCDERATAIADCTRALESQCPIPREESQETTESGQAEEGSDGEEQKSLAVGLVFYSIVFIVLIVLFQCV